ncbi:phage virion morphogenesis protein [Fertoebacter nigrum]|uniref:Phage virion morphogenesis protein n=1 Tax=Fertoeibacter niger TaxID=2656921 RepID=A0A8X8H3E5_9RHOB|nr:phage virion morphogenesis protein [Fertoeibacter niger]NUB46495.1 phage virion morphogenesis protein [Fertoeibacter niger]
MPGVRFTFKVDPSFALERLQELFQRLENRQRFYNAVGFGLENSTKDRFETQIAPDGKPWQKLKPATIKARERNGQTPIKILSAGRKAESLRFGFFHQATEQGVTVATQGGYDYQRIHQLGGTIKVAEREGKVYRHVNPNTAISRGRFVAPAKANQITDAKIPAHTITIPARPYLGVSESDRETTITEAVEEWLTGKI